jgi:hypothetical protein
MLAHKFVAGDTVLVDAEEGEIRLRQAEETVRELVMKPVPG